MLKELLSFSFILFKLKESTSSSFLIEKESLLFILLSLISSSSFSFMVLKYDGLLFISSFSSIESSGIGNEFFTNISLNLLLCSLLSFNKLVIVNLFPLFSLLIEPLKFDS